MRILILGATGQIGRAVVEALARTEHEVSVMVRNACDARFPDNVRVICHPIFSADTFRAALQGVDYVIYGIGLPEQFTFDLQIFDRVNCLLLRTFLGEFRKSGIGGLTYISTYEVFENFQGRMDETRPIADESHMTAYFQSMVRAYRLVLEFAETTGVRLMTLHPAAVYGGINTGGGITDFVENLVCGSWHKVPFITRTRFPVVHIDSLAEAVIKSIGKTGAYIVSDQMTSLEEIARTTHDRVASRLPFIMPVSMTKLGVALLEAAAKLIRVKPVASIAQLDYLTKGWEPSAAKATSELSWKPLTLGEGVDRYLAARNAARGGDTRSISSIIIALLQLLTAVGLLGYWVLFYSVGLAPEELPAGYFAFQNSFTAPDIILALAFVRAATWLLSGDGLRRRRGQGLSLACGGAMLFLGMLDISFNLLGSVYTLWSVDLVVEMTVNAWCIGFGTLCALACAASPTRRLLAGVHCAAVG
jgi:nucleoside-diphosphate-sugar epimerase